MNNAGNNHSTTVRLTTCRLWLGQESFEREELVTANVYFVTLLEGARDHALAHLHREVDLVDGTEDLVNATDDRLVLKVDGGVEVGDLVGHDRLAEHLVFYCVDEGAHFCLAVRCWRGR